MKKLFIYCSGGVGREVCDIADRLNFKADRWDEVCFIDDTKDQGMFYGKRIYPYSRFRELFSQQDCELVIANGEPSARQVLYEKVKTDGYRLTRIIDKASVISPTARLEEGVIAYPFVFVSSNVQIGTNTLIYDHSTIAHDSIIGQNTVLSIGAKVAGNCTVSDNCFIGAGAVIREKVEIGTWSIVGMGTVVCHSLPPNGIYMGNPAVREKENINRKVFH